MCVNSREYYSISEISKTPGIFFRELVIYESCCKREMQSACHQLQLYGFYCSRRKRSTICGQLEAKNLFLREAIHMSPTIQPAVHSSVFLSVEVSIYTECNKQYTDKSWCMFMLQHLILIFLRGWVNMSL